MGNTGRKYHQKKSLTMFQRLLGPLFLLLFVEIVILVGGVGVTNIIGEIERNSRELMNQQIINRRNYLENSMVRNWSELSRNTQEIDDDVSRMLKDGTLTLEELDGSSEAAAPLIHRIADDLISTLYTKRVNGIFVMFSTGELPEQGTDCPGKTGIYIRDLDSDAPPSVQRADLLLERAPISVVQELSISTDSTWNPLFTFDENEQEFYDCIRLPYEAARQAEEITSASDFGRWSTTPFKMTGRTQTRLGYVQPLVLEDGTVYGVIGIEVETEYLRALLPYEELLSDAQGSYLLGVTRGGVFTADVVSGPARQYITPGYSMPLSVDGEGGSTADDEENSTVGGEGSSAADDEENSTVGGEGSSAADDEGNSTVGGEGRSAANGEENSTLKIGRQSYHVRGEVFSLYNSNTPFLTEQWTLVGIAPERELYNFSHQLFGVLIGALFACMLVGVFGSLFISRKLARPILRLSRELEEVGKNPDNIPNLSQTGFLEIDNFARSFTELSREVVDTATRFTRIIDMASVELGAFEVWRAKDRLFVTENFFSMFNMDVEIASLTAESFGEQLVKIRQTVMHTDIDKENTLYHLRLPDGDSRYLRAESTIKNGRHIGLVEDVTAATKERLRIEKERDYDVLTGLFSRRAFYRKMEGLFDRPERLKHAALVMLDLDNLKSINDRFGHDWGDKYICQAAQCFAKAVSEDTLCARVSGDEFYLLFYGYENQEQIRAQIDNLSRAIRSSSFQLLSGETVHISATGGVAWYPDDSDSFRDLMKYADFAMYQVKHGKKGSLEDFNLGVYNRERFQFKRRGEFKLLVAEERLDYYFQPIIDARTGAVAAYEALMRVNMQTLRNPFEVLETARAEDALGDIERLTWRRSLACYQELLDQKLVDENALLFVNSIASQVLDEEDRNELYGIYSQLLSHVVVEITEYEEVNEAITEIKRNAAGHAGMIALDDYGSGYNSEINLLILSPKFIKVDMAIIRDIDTDEDKQKILENIVAYAHEREMLIVAEGVETLEELRCVLKRGVDLLQGYFLARPAKVPGEINPAALEEIRACSQRPGE